MTVHADAHARHATARADDAATRTEFFASIQPAGRPRGLPRSPAAMRESYLLLERNRDEERKCKFAVRYSAALGSSLAYFDTLVSPSLAYAHIPVAVGRSVRGGRSGGRCQFVF